MSATRTDNAHLTEVARTSLDFIGIVDDTIAVDPATRLVEPWGDWDLAWGLRP